MKTTLCTLYNSLYLDKGLVLFDSLKENAKDFELYVLCMDDKCYEVLKEIEEERLKPIRLSDVENEKMIEAKDNRTVAEYCWTCSSRLVQYILYTYQPECCTYIDADMYFYHDPQILIDEMLEAGKSVMMVPHRFTDRNLHLAEKVGTYCVEFNTFKNDRAGREVLSHWHDQCLECCSNLGDGIHWGDQKYMDEWPVIYPNNVHVCENLGAGIAPWNIDFYCFFDEKDKTIGVKGDNNVIPIVFYHFQSLFYLSEEVINTGIETRIKSVNYMMVDRIYRKYLVEIARKKKMLFEKYNIATLIKQHPSSITKGLGWRQYLKSSKVGRYILTRFSFLRLSKSYYIKL